MPPRLKKDQSDIQGVYKIISSVFANPFFEMKALSLSTGTAPLDKINFLNLHAIRKIAMNTQEHLINRTIEFFEQSEKRKLGTFSLMKKVVKVKKRANVQSDIFGKTY